MRRIFSSIVLVALFCATIGILGLANLKPAIAASDSDTQTIILTVTSTITLTLATTTVNMGTLTPGVPISAGTSLTVVTNDYNGWNLQVRRDDAASTLNLNGSSAPDVTFPDATAWTYATPNSTSTPGANLSFRLMETGTDAALVSTTLWGADAGTKLWAGFPTSNQQVTGISSYVAATQNVAYEFRADAPGTQQSGVYYGDITFTAITNP